MNIVIKPEITTKDFEKMIEPEMDKSIKHFEKEMLAIRTGRATTSMVEDIKVNCYGDIMKMKEVAAISTPEARLIVIQAWDKSLLPDIEKAINESDLGAAPVNNGELIRITLPMMSSERRSEMTKTLHKKLEECKTGIRNVRKDFQNHVRDAEKKKVLTEDYAKKLLDVLQKETDKFIAKSDQLSAKKEDELKG